MQRFQPVVEVFEVEDFVLEFLELLVPEAEILADEVFELIDFQQVVRLGGGEVSQGHAGFDAVLDVQVEVEVGHGPEVDELD